MQVLRPIQFATLFVRSWPFVPDVISLGSIAQAQISGSQPEAASTLPDQPCISPMPSSWQQAGLAPPHLWSAGTIDLSPKQTDRPGSSAHSRSHGPRLGHDIPAASAWLAAWKVKSPPHGPLAQATSAHQLSPSGDGPSGLFSSSRLTHVPRRIPAWLVLPQLSVIPAHLLQFPCTLSPGKPSLLLGLLLPHSTCRLCCSLP